MKITNRLDNTNIYFINYKSWIKYEQTIDPETNIWSKPYVGALVYQNLAYLKSTFQTGSHAKQLKLSKSFQKVYFYTEHNQIKL